MEITNIVTSHITSQDPSDSSAPTWQPFPSAMAEDVETGVWPSVQSTVQLYSLLYNCTLHCIVGEDKSQAIIVII